MVYVGDHKICVFPITAMAPSTAMISTTYSMIEATEHRQRTKGDMLCPTLFQICFRDSFGRQELKFLDCVNFLQAQIAIQCDVAFKLCHPFFRKSPAKRVIDTALALDDGGSYEESGQLGDSSRVILQGCMLSLVGLYVVIEIKCVKVGVGLCKLAKSWPVNQFLACSSTTTSVDSSQELVWKKVRICRIP